MSARNILVVAASILLAVPVSAAEKAAPKQAQPQAAKQKDPKQEALPYLGPGADKLGAEEYERVYKNYIQTSILLGYPFLKDTAPACDQALSAVFRGAGFLGYPVPSEAQNLRRGVKALDGRKVETYEGAGTLIQVVRSKAGGPESLLLLNTSSVKAMRRLAGYAKAERLSLERDAATGLERVHGIPVGYPSPFLTADGQGLFVKALQFNGKLEGCQPVDFQDNTWTAGFDLTDSRCRELQGEAEKVWHEELSPGDFAARELQRMKEKALKSALEKGNKEGEAKQLVEKHFQPPFTNEINIVGSAMRNLAQCNLLALGRAGGPNGNKTGASPGATAPGEQGNGAGSAK